MVEDVCRGLGLRCWRGTGLGLALGFGSGLGPWCGVGFGWLPGGGLGWWLGFRLQRGGVLGILPGCRRGLRWGALPPRLAGAAGALSVAGWPGVGTGLAACLGGVARGSGCGVLDEAVVLEEDEEVVVVEVV